MSSKISKTPCPRVVEKAKEVEASLSREHPSFIKEVRQSNLSPSFLMRPPREFCKLHLRNLDEALVVLEGENGKQYKVKYIGRNTALSQGWKQFCISNNLQEGDVLDFHLVEPCKFKVSIQRKNDFDAVDRDPTMLEPNEINLKKRKSKNQPMVAQKFYTNISQENAEATDSFTNEAMFSKIDSCFRNFKIIVDNHTIDSEIPKHTRTDYFTLCRTRNTLLHRHLIKGIDSKLAASIISETTNIAEAIRNSEICTAREDIAYWNIALQSFKFFGMDVDLIRARLNRLLDIARDCSKVITDLKNNKNTDAESEGVRIEEEIREHENKIEELKILKRRVEMRKEESVKEIVEKCKVMYKEEAKAPW